MRSRTTTALAVLAVLLLAPAAAPARADDPLIMLRIDVQDEKADRSKVKVTVPLSLIEVVVENVDASEVLKEIKAEKGIDLAKMWRQLRSADIDEFITIDEDNHKVKVFKDRRTFRVTVQEEGFEEPNVQVRIPFALMDYLFGDHKEGFMFSELIETLRGELPLTIVEARHGGDSVRIWIEEK